MREPAFWRRPAGLASRLLSPLAAAYGAVAGARMARPGRNVGIPVICIGNLTLGGAGKTPTALRVARILAQAGRKPFVLSRGYGGSIAGPVQVDPALDRAAEVGDEPLLLAQSVPTVVARDRVAGALAALEAGADVLVMDDGFQSPNLHKDLSMLVVDGRRGIGNRKVFPAGPLRAPLDAQMRRASAVIVVGSGGAGDELANVASAYGLPVFRGRLEPDASSLAKLQRNPVLAFAGIGDPDKFFETLRVAGIDVRDQVSFPDHHRMSSGEAQALLDRAKRSGSVPVTTEKDMARLRGEPDMQALAAAAQTLPVQLVVSEDDEFRKMVVGASVGA